MSKADIQINGHKYSVACAPGQEDRLRVLGGRLDARVKQISNAVGDIGEARLLLIAALALLDEVEAASSPATAPSGDAALNAINDAASRIAEIASRLENR